MGPGRGCAVALFAVIVAKASVSGTPPGAPEFTFGAAGDFGTGRSFRATVDAVQQRNPDFFIALGDLTQSSTGEEGWCRYWNERLTSTRLLVVPGNHDTDIGRYVRYCGNPFQAMITGTYPWQYYFDYPPTTPLGRFIAVSPSIANGAPVMTNYALGTPGFAFVAEAIDSARRRGLKWVVVAMHKNYIATFVKRNEVSTDRGRTFMTMLLDKRVDLILQGHEHGYARSKQLSTNPSTCPVLPVDGFNDACVVDADNDLVKGAGTVIQIISTGGKGMRLVERSDSEHRYFVDNFRDADSETFGFGEFHVSPADLSFSFVSAAGQPFTESFRIREQHSTQGVSTRH
jgi:3',5'-cyclic AMP phosphodiesterase CpdA